MKLSRKSRISHATNQKLFLKETQNKIITKTDFLEYVINYVYIHKIGRRSEAIRLTLLYFVSMSRGHKKEQRA